MTAFPVLLYHSVHPEPADRWAITPARFAEHVEAIAACGRTPVSVPELAAGLRGEARLPERPVAVTFDDGFADNEAAIDLLAQHGIPAALYVTASYVGRPGMLDAGGVAALASRDGVEIGAHAVNHVRLDALTDPEIEHEVSGSRARIAELAQHEVTSFAYPHGAYDRRVRAAVDRAGFDSAVAVRNALSHPQDDPLAVARWTITGDVTAHRVAEVLRDGGGLRPAPRRELLRTRGWRMARRARRQLTAGRS